MAYRYIPKGICVKDMTFDIQDGLVRNVHFMGGCDGNLKALMVLLDGMPAEEVIAKCTGITCGKKDTSCPDQLATALKKALHHSKHN